MQEAVNGSGVGAGTTNVEGSSGAGHGGRGGRGNGSSLTGAFYGNIINPQMFGSTGGGGKAFGGGVLFINSSGLTLDGVIKANGQNAKVKTNHGGGSGGSILITTGMFEGSGSLQANGGAGGVNGGGGGSGGRIAIHYDQSTFTGTTTAFGGDSPIEAGAAGTIFKRDIKNNFRHLEVHNKGRKPGSEDINDYKTLDKDSARTWITFSYLSSALKETTTEDVELPDVPKTVLKGYEFDEVTLGGSAHLAFEGNREQIRLHSIKKLSGNFQGGSYGFLHTGPFQFIVISQTNRYIPVNLRIHRNGYLRLPSQIMLHKNYFSLNGYLIGVNHLRISESVVTLGDRSGAEVTGLLQHRHYSFKTVTVMNRGVLKGTDTKNKFTLKVDTFTIEAGGIVTGSNVSVESKFLTVKESGQVNVDGQGVACEPTNILFSGSGGSHAGYGGFGAQKIDRSKPFGSVFQPKEFGRAGRSGRPTFACSGGRGGGILNFTVSGTMTIEGAISSRYRRFKKVLRNIFKPAQIPVAGKLIQDLIKLTMYSVYNCSANLQLYVQLLAIT